MAKSRPGFETAIDPEKKILIVEDESVLALDLANQIEGLGFKRPSVATNAKDAQNKVKSEHPDIILMDINLKGDVDGTDLSLDIKKKHKIPVIFLTAYHDAGTMNRARSSEPFGFLAKPFRIEDVHSSIYMALYKAEMEQKLEATKTKLDLILSHLGEAVFIIKDQKVDYLNPYAGALVAQKRKTVLSKKIDQVLKLQNKTTGQSISYIQKVVEEGSAFDFPDGTVLVSKKGDETPVDGRAVAFRDIDGRVAINIVLRDIRHVLAARTLQAENVELQRAKDEALAMVSTRPKSTKTWSDSDHQTLKKQYRSLLEQAVDEPLEQDQIKAFCQDCFTQNLSATDILDIHIDTVEGLLDQFSELESDQVAGRLRLMVLEVVVQLLECYRSGEPQTTSPVDDPIDHAGIPLDLDATPDELNQYEMDTRDGIEALENLMVRLESSDDGPDVLAEAFRIAHTIKGNSGVVRHKRMVMLTHQIETLFDWVRNQKLELTKPLIEAVLAGLDGLKKLLDELKTQTQSGFQVSEILQKLEVFKPDEDQDQETKDLQQPLQLTQAQIERCRLSKVKGLTPYFIKITLSEDCAYPAIAALAVVEEMKPLGEFVAVSPSLEQLAEGQAGSWLQLVLLTSFPKSRVDGVCAGLLDVDAVSVSEWKGQAKSGEAGTKTEIIKVDIQYVDKLMQSLGEMTSENNFLHHSISGLEQQFGSCEPVERIREYQERSQKHFENMQQQIEHLRMMPIGNLFAKFPRTVRDLASKLGKDVALKVEGGDLAIDKLILDGLVDPMTHIIRNSLDHGLEAPDQRKAEGKPEQGTLKLVAYYKDEHIVIDVVDDGKGIDPKAILERAISRGLVSEADSQALSEDQILKFIFMPGFSTAEQISEVSGRGVGMDIVKTKVESLNGRLNIKSKVGAGTTMSITLPNSKNIMDGISFVCGPDMYFVPIQYIVKFFKIDREEIRTVLDQDPYIYLDEHYIRLLELNKIFDTGARLSDAKIVLALADQGQQLCLAVDDVHDRHQVVIRDLAKNMSKIPGVLGVGVLGDGRIAKIIDVPYLIEQNHDSRTEKLA